MDENKRMPISRRSNDRKYRRRSNSISERKRNKPSEKFTEDKIDFLEKTIDEIIEKNTETNSETIQVGEIFKTEIPQKTPSPPSGTPPGLIPSQYNLTSKSTETKTEKTKEDAKISFIISMSDRKTSNKRKSISKAKALEKLNRKEVKMPISLKECPKKEAKRDENDPKAKKTDENNISNAAIFDERETFISKRSTFKNECFNALKNCQISAIWEFAGEADCKKIVKEEADDCIVSYYVPNMTNHDTNGKVFNEVWRTTGTFDNYTDPRKMESSKGKHAKSPMVHSKQPQSTPGNSQKRVPGTPAGFNRTVEWAKQRMEHILRKRSKILDKIEFKKILKRVSNVVYRQHKNSIDKNLSFENKESWADCVILDDLDSTNKFTFS